MNWSALCRLAQEIVAVIDTGKYNNISIADVHEAVKNRCVLRMLKERTADDIDLSILLDTDTYPNFESDCEENIEALYDAYGGQDRRKWGIENSGLCLLLAWIIELINQEARKAQSYEYNPEGEV